MPFLGLQLEHVFGRIEGGVSLDYVKNTLLGELGVPFLGLQLEHVFPRFEASVSLDYMKDTFLDELQSARPWIMRETLCRRIGELSQH